MGSVSASVRQCVSASVRQCVSASVRQCVSASVRQFRFDVIVVDRDGEARSCIRENAEWSNGRHCFL
jgi:hypothetical protein